MTQPQADDDRRGPLRQQLQALRAALAQEDISVPLDSAAPPAAQLAQLREAVCQGFAHCRQREEAGRAAEEALQRSRALLAEAEKLSHTGAWAWDVLANCWTFSEEWLAIHGATRRTLTPDELLAIAHPEDRAAVQQAFDAVRAGIRPYDLEHRIIRQDTGEVRRVRACGRYVRDAAGTVVRVYGFVQDITERQRAEEARRESEERFSAMANNIPQLAWMADETGAICWFNQRWYDYTGATDEEMRGWGWQQVHHPDYVQHVVDTFRQAIQTGQFWEATFPLRGKDGQYRWFLARAVPIRDDRGAVVRWFGTHTDITELRETQQQLRQLTATLEQRVRARTEELARALANEQSARAEAESVRARFQGLFESAPDGIVIVDAEGRIILVNTQLERLTGYTRDDLLGKPVEVLVPARYGDIHVRHRAAYMAAPRTRPMGVGLDLYLRCKDGREVPVEISLSPSATLEGIVVYASIRDITARKAADAEIKRLNEELQHHLARLEMANKELEAFSYSVSHDLRAPLRRIDGFSKILLDKYADRLDETGRDYLARVRNAAVHMGRLIDDMLNLSRVGRREMQRMPVDLSDLAASILAELHQREPERQVRAEVQPGLQVIGDAGLLRIALENLLGNAWKFTGKTPEARIEMGATSQEGARVYYVRDNGAGFDMRYTDKLFSSFQRLHSEEEFPGTGIGLAIVQRIIARHGGRIWAEGEEGKGATFYFTLGEEHP